MELKDARAFTMLGSGIALPKRIVHSSEIDTLMGYDKGTTFKQCGVRQRHYVMNESIQDLAVTAAQGALKQANCEIDNVDCVILACGTLTSESTNDAKQIIHALTDKRDIHAFDVKLSCLSFIHALNQAIELLHNENYQRLLIIACDITSTNLNWKHIESSGIFGDGAAAVLIGKANNKSTHKLLSYAADVDEVCVETCPYLSTQHQHANHKLQQCCMHIDQESMSMLSAKVLPDLVERLFQQYHFSMSMIDWVVPHQSSRASLAHMQHRLHIPLGKMVNIIENVGNQISASLPTALHILLNSQQLVSGQKIMLIGAGTGMSAAGMIIEF